MIEIKDIEKLAELARLDIPQDEKESLSKDVDSILAYISKISEAQALSADTSIVRTSDAEMVYNVLRDDANVHEPGIHTERLLAEAPQTQDGYVKVKKIL